MLIKSMLLLCGLTCSVAQADLPAARKWLKQEFRQSSISPEQQLAEMQWFIDAAKPFRGMQIRVVSEQIGTHFYERDVLAKAFADITGIRVQHDTIPEGRVVETLLQQTRTGENLYDAYVNDTDSIGAHFRHNWTVSLSAFMQGEGKDVTLPTLKEERN